MKKGEAVIFRSYSSVVEQLIESNERASKIEADINEKILAESVQQEEDEDSQLITFSSGKNIVNDQSEEERDAMIDFELGIGKKENPKARNTFVFNQDNFNEMIEDETPKFKSSSVSVRQ
jgi:ABC-type thiamine transport system substrate-binding protein